MTFTAELTLLSIGKPNSKDHHLRNPNPQKQQNRTPMTQIHISAVPTHNEHPL